MAVNLAIALANVQNKKGFGLFVDMEKAYDRVSHHWLLHVLKQMQLGSFIENWIGRIYKSATSRVLVNNSFSEPFRIAQGVRQGDALSCFLFILSLAPLTHAIKANRNLHPLCVSSLGPFKDVVRN